MSELAQARAPAPDPQTRSGAGILSGVRRKEAPHFAQDVRAASASRPLLDAPTASPGGGERLPAETRAFFEPRLGHDFSQVRVHADSVAATSARAVSARAYTLGRDIVFGAGEYAPGRPAGERLLAHELAHVIQQRQVHEAVLQRDPLPEQAAPTRTYDQVWREFQQQRMQRQSQQAIALVPDILRLMSGTAARDHAIELALWLMDEGQWPLAQQALQRVEDYWRVSFHPTEPVFPLVYSLFSDPATLVERAAVDARAGRHERAFRLMGLAALFAQMQLNLTSRSREAEQYVDEERVKWFRNRAEEAPTEPQRLIQERAAMRFGQFSGSLGRVFAYSDLGRCMELLRAVLGLYPRLEREATAANDTAAAATYHRLAGDFRQELTRRYLLPTERTITLESSQTEAPRGGIGYTVHGVNDREEIVTPMPGTRTPEEIGFYPSYVSDMEHLVSAIAGQEELLTELYNTPEFRAAFGNRRVDLNQLATRVRVWELMYQVYARTRGAAAFEALVRLMERYLRSYTAHTEYNIRDFGVSYLSTTFPEDLLGRTVRDCGAYALTVAYEIYRVARSASPRLPISLTLYTMPEHVALVIEHRGENRHYIVNNDQIMGPYQGDILPNVARAYQAAFGRPFGVAPTVGVTLPGPEATEREFRGTAWTRYQASTAWGLETEPPTGPEDVRSEDERAEATYRRYNDSQRLFNQGATGLQAALDTLRAELAGLRPDAERERLDTQLARLTVGVGALITIFAAYGPGARIAVPSVAVQRQLPARAGYLYTLPPGVTVHPLTRFGRALLRLSAIGGTLTPDQQQIIDRLDAIADFHRDLDAYRAAGMGPSF